MDLIEKAKELAEKFLVKEFRVHGQSVYAQRVREVFEKEKMYFEETDNMPKFFETEDKKRKLYIQCEISKDEVDTWANKNGHAVVQVVDGFGEEASNYLLVGTVLFETVLGDTIFHNLLN